MIPTIRERRALLLVIALVATAAAPARAQHALPVFVSFEFRAKSVANLYTDSERAAASDRVAQSLADRCAAVFKPWQFRRASEGQYPRLAFRLVKTAGAYELAGTLVVTAQETDGAAWSVPIFKPGDLDALGTPSPQTWPDKVVGGFEALLRAKESDIRAALQKRAPIAAVVAPLASPPRTAEEAQGVLPLAFDRYRGLATSEFAILVLWQGGSAIIHSAGIGTDAEYPGGAFRGITVQYLHWEHPIDERTQRVAIAQRLDVLGNVRPKLVFLEREEPLGGALLASSPQP